MFCSKYDINLYKVIELNYKHNDNYYKNFLLNIIFI